ncbi:MAG: zinc ribbon domain-containing protein [Nitrososphaerales archaeon]
MQSFTDSVEDESTEQGFQFVFKCQICGSSYQSPFTASEAAREKAIFNKVSQFGGMFSNKASVAGAFGGQAYRTPEWNKEHDAALKKATTEAESHFHQCPQCHKYVCDNDWKSDASLCSVDAAAKASASAAAPPPAAEKPPQDAVCPKCGQPSGGGKFCNNCGAPLGPQKCAACGTENGPGAKFCGGCGAKL